MTELFTRVAERGDPPHSLTVRRTLVLLFTVFSAVALLGWFGQRPQASTVRAPRAVLRLSAPRTVRGGLLFQGRFQVRALGRIKAPTVVLDDGWIEGMQINSIEPQPSSEESRDGHVALVYDALEPGDLLRGWVMFQTQPTNVGRRALGFELDDGRRRLGRIDRRLTILP